MKTFKLYKDQKCTIWRREYYTIEAENIKQAIEGINFESFDTDEVEYLMDTTEDMTPTENDNFSTIEVYNTNDNDLIYKNGL